MAALHVICYDLCGSITQSFAADLNAKQNYIWAYSKVNLLTQVTFLRGALNFHDSFQIIQYSMCKWIDYELTTLW
jgi:hypothetical protein